jgi:ABC-type phosphate transport system substrate-binding protein
MKTRHTRMPLARTVALTAGLCALSAAAFTSTSLAAAPGGNACQSADGRITGRGATFQTKAMAALIAGYTEDVCGPVISDATSGVNMLAYNVAGAPNGSGQGLEATRCRTDAFGGTDIPYDQQDLTLMNGPLIASCQSNAYVGPYQPTPSPYPNAADQQKNVMSFPVGGSSVSIIIRLDAGPACPGRTAGSVLNLTKEDLTALAGGDIATWGDSRLVADNAQLSGCTTPVVRVVRLDKSGTTQVFKNYLKKVDPSRSITPTTCDTTNPWTTLAQDANNTSWPGAPQGPDPNNPTVTVSQPTPATATCSELANAGFNPPGQGVNNGNGPMVTKVRNTNGAFAYPDLADGNNQAGTILANVRNATNTAFIPPKKAVTNAANCDFATGAPGVSNNDAVGLNLSDNWGTDSSVNHSDTTNQGGLYPICALTFDLVYTGNSAATGSGPISRLSNNQRRTLYSFFEYAFTPIAQDRLSAPNTFYAGVPAGILLKVRQGFKANF